MFGEKSTDPLCWVSSVYWWVLCVGCSFQICCLILGAVFNDQRDNLQSLCLPVSVLLRSEHTFLDKFLFSLWFSRLLEKISWSMLLAVITLWSWKLKPGWKKKWSTYKKKKVENVSKTGYLIFYGTIQTALSFNAKI